MSKGNLLPIFDGHNDVLEALYERANSDAGAFFSPRTRGHLDLPRAREGGFAGGFFAVYLPSDPSQAREEANELWPDPPYAQPLPPALDIAYARHAAFTMCALLFRIEAASEGQVKVVRTAGELEACLRDGVIGAILHFEGAEAIDSNLNALEVFYQAGLRSLGPVWSRPTIFGHGVSFANPGSPDTGPGLTDAGKELVRACNRLGIMIDLSHLNEQGFWDVARISDAPLVATHSNAHALCPSSRNLTDRQLDAIRESDGMVGLNFACGFLRSDGRENADTPLDVLVDHIDYLVERIGIDRVGFGSDFDGALIPNDLGSVAGLPRLIDALQARGYDDAARRKIAHANWVRVLGKTWH
jgi:membrane dipeptidase